MLIQDQIDNDIKDAMRAKDADKLSVLRLLKAALKNAAIEKGGADAKLEDAESTTVIRKQVKQRQDSVEGFVKGGRPELAAKENNEMEILNAYLPKAMSESDLEDLVADSIRESGATSKQQMGLAMKVATAKAAGRVDGKTLSQAVQKALA
ncbi:MAG TPA: GatB/YqeY domain-containing protein [Chthoniobacterales bacterium]|jgi:hypothetical protein